MFFVASCWASSFPSCVGRGLGHSDSARSRNDGPFHHVELTERSFAFRPREGMSAGFNSPGQCLHESLDVKLRISSTRCCTYCFHILSFFIQQRVVMESVQLNVLNCLTVEVNLLTSLARRTVPSNSRRGIVCFFIGATLDFEATKLT